MKLIHLYRVANWLYRKKVPILPKIIYALQYYIFNSSVPASVKIGKNTKFAYGGIGVVIHGKAEIGDDCLIGQGITIGGKSKIYEYPKIGDKVYLGAGCRVVGPITVGDDVVIGPNSVVVKDVPSNTIVVGIPAKVLREGIKKDDYV
jgi:serine O-acetyltransferase